MADAAVVVGEEGSGGGVDYGGLAVRAGEGGDGVEGLPGGDNQDFDLGGAGVC